MENTIDIQQIKTQKVKLNYKTAGLVLAYPIAYLYWRMIKFFPIKDYAFVGPTIFCLVFIIWSEIILRGYKDRSNKGSMFWYISMVTISLLSTYSPSSALSIFAIHICAIYSVMYSNKNLLEGKTGEYILCDILRGVFKKGFGNLSNIFDDIGKIKKEKNELKPVQEEGNSSPEQKKEKATAKMYGFFVVIIAVIFFLIIVGLLGSVNEQFGKITSGIFEHINDYIMIYDSELINTISMCIFLAIPTAIYLYALVSKCATENGSKDREEGKKFLDKKAERQIVSTKLINVVLSFFVVLYIIFFLFEGKCIFGWIFNNAPKGFELVKYARGGFFELVWVMVINMLIYLLVKTYTKEASSSRMNKGLLSCLMSAIVIFAIVSFSKLYLYVDHFGYTPKRILAMWGAIVLVAGAILVIVSLFKAKSYARSWIVFVVVSYIIMCMFGTGLSLYEKFNQSAQQGKHLYITDEIAREEKANSYQYW